METNEDLMHKTIFGGRGDVYIQALFFQCLFFVLIKKILFFPVLFWCIYCDQIENPFNFQTVKQQKE